MTTEITDGIAEEAWAKLWVAARDVPDYATLQALCRKRRRLAAQSAAPPLPVQIRLALLSGATTALLEEPLTLLLESLGIGVELHASPFDTYAREMLDASSATSAFAPHVAVVVTSPANIPPGEWPRWDAPADEVRDRVEHVCAHWLRLCRSLHERTGCEIVLSNFHQLPFRSRGAASVKAPGDANRFLRAVNEALASQAPPYVHIHDVDALATQYGLMQWVDVRYWYAAKLPVSFACLVPWLRNVAAIIGARYGRSAKCVVVDLDNTLWSGVVGDDGVDGIVVGSGDAVGEAFADFQAYLRRLKDRGVLLAVCSKNDEASALAPFQSRPEMVLRREDFAAFVANWRPKSENLREIAERLNIGLDAVVFVDDNPAEREEVRQAVPEVRVLELSSDPSDYVSQLDRTGWLETVVISAEDLSRNAMYNANREREALETKAGGYSEYLASLAQRAVVAPFAERHLDRIAQLTNKTNQFNLTTRRYSRSELAAFSSSPDHLTTCVRLRDRFGDNGLVSVLVARGVGTDLWIDLWLMSCRVFNRQLEHVVCNDLVRRAAGLGYRRVHGVYLPTARNGLVKTLYGQLGFEPADSIGDGDHWVLDVDRYQPFEALVTLVDETSFEMDVDRG